MNKREQRVLDYLKDFKLITTYDAFNELGNSRLSDSIFRLRNMGYDLEDVFVNGKNRYGDNVRWKAYFFSKDKKEVLKRLNKSKKMSWFKALWK